MNLNFQIEQEIGKEKFNVIVIIKFHELEYSIKDEIKNSLIDILKEMFELETIRTLEVTEPNKSTTQFKINTKNTKVVHRLNETLQELFKREQREKAKLNTPKFDLSNINLN